VNGVAITGWAWRTPLGDDVEAVMRRLWNGERAAAPLTRFAGASFACRRVAVIPGEPVPRRQQRFLRRMGAFAVDVARELADGTRPPLSGDRLGLFFGYGGLRAHWPDMMPALHAQRDDGRDAWKRGLALLHPFWMLQHLSNNAHALAAEELGARGDGLTLAGANAGAQALGAAARALEVGAVDVAVVVAYDTLIEPETLVALEGDGAHPGETAPRAPYDPRATGFVPGEAAAGVVLERAERAGGRALGLVEAWDAADGQRGAPAAALLARVISMIEGDGAETLGVIDGAAQALPSFDDSERATLAARPALVDSMTPLCATLAAMGQLGAASSVVQAIALAAQLRAGRLAPVAGLSDAAPGPLRPLVRAEAPGHPTGLGISVGAPGLLGVVRVRRP
jgi:3-oxoacyl-(acyl-carrier-protein) synthase